jgi:hypothetical protein
MPVFTRRLCRKFLLLGVNLAVQVAAARSGLLQPRAVARPETAAGQETIRGLAGEDVASRPRLGRRDNDELAELKFLTCERLKTASTGVGLARLQLRAGQIRGAQATLDGLHQEIQSLRRWLESGGVHVLPHQPVSPHRPRPIRRERTARKLLAGDRGRP